MKAAILAIGLPGSGKTTTLRPFAERHGFVYICRDDIREELTGSAEDQSRNREVWEEERRRVAHALAEGRTVVLDSTFAEAKKRRDAIRFLRERGAELVLGVHADVPTETAKERNAHRARTVPEHVIDWMHERLAERPPSLADGFDAMVKLEETERLETLLAS